MSFIYLFILNTSRHPLKKRERERNTSRWIKILEFGSEKKKDFFLIESLLING